MYRARLYVDAPPFFPGPLAAPTGPQRAPEHPPRPVGKWPASPQASKRADPRRQAGRRRLRSPNPIMLFW